ncbi:MAG TPA: hypothetical protein VK833_01565, partial [Gillisia sp.]|nr:hypothetical protein [Gillisia sp.]
PSVISISHMYAHEDIGGCDNHSDMPFHKKNIDCELCKLHSTPFLAFEIQNFNLQEPLVINKKFFNSYLFLSDYQRLSFELRGPPGSV